MSFVFKCKKYVVKKYLSWLPVVLLTLSVTNYSQKKVCPSLEKTISKTISFAVYKSNSYTSKIYNNTSAQLQITIEKVSDKKHTVIWGKTFDAKLLKHYPDLKNALLQKVTVPDVACKKERLEISYTLTYNSNCSELHIQGDTIVVCTADSKIHIGV